MVDKISEQPNLSKLDWTTPWRYPGGKRKHTKIIQHIIDTELNVAPDMTWVEPFVGGGGFCNVAKHFSTHQLNDSDPFMAAWWQIVCDPNPTLFNALIQKIGETIPSVELHTKLRHQLKNFDRLSLSNKAYTAFVLNRTSFGGLIAGSPIGGADQTGKEKIDSYFNADRHVLQHRWMRKQYCGQAYNQDFEPFLDKHSGFAIIDPPYVNTRKRTYRSVFAETDHVRLAELLDKRLGPWLVTCETHPLITNLYQKYPHTTTSTAYLLRGKNSSSRTKTKELFIWKLAD